MNNTKMLIKLSKAIEEILYLLLNLNKFATCKCKCYAGKQCLIT